LLARLASACLGGVLRLDYLAASSGAIPNAASRNGQPGWWPTAKRIDPKRLLSGEALVVAEPPEQTASKTKNTGQRAKAAKPMASAFLPQSQWAARQAPLSSSEEYRLVLRARGGCERSRARLIEQHLPLVISVAKRFGDRRMPLDDLIVEGCIGLMTAIEKFDAERGHRLSTYARWWIGQSIALASMNQSAVVRVPVHVQRMARKASKAERDADHLAAEPVASFDAANLADERVEPTTIEQPVNFSEVDLSEDMMETLASPEGSQPTEIIGRLQEYVVLENALGVLTEKERSVVRARFGLDDGETQTYEHIASKMKLSDERVRQILKTAITKLRADIQRQGLADSGRG